MLELVGALVVSATAAAGLAAIIAALATWFAKSVLQIKHIAVGIFIVNKLKQAARNEDDIEQVKIKLWKSWSSFVDANTHEDSPNA